MTYKEINEIFGIPQTTLRDWKNSKGWRKTLFEILRALSKEEALQLKQKTK
ncbi:MAG: hypothetical protein GXO62_08035 [Epsilonproteobacteria bacterium]|nr:hypothetical protein [Campylobacterota bacterium]